MPKWQAVHGEAFHGWVIKTPARLICIAQGGSNQKSMLGIMTDGLKSVIIMAKWTPVCTNMAVYDLNDGLRLTLFCVICHFIYNSH